MAMRLIQIVCSDAAPDEVARLYEGFDVVARWDDRTEPGRTILQVVAPAEACETILDRFQQKFGNLAGFHVALLPLEAYLPRQEETPQETVAETPAEAETARHRISREELYAEISEGIRINRAFVALTVLSSIVAAIGLVRNDIAVIIGAMVIAPLLTPNVGLALATTLGDPQLALTALKTNLVGFLLTLLFAVGVGLIFTVDPSIPAIAARTRIGTVDIVLALAAGTAGTLAFTTGVPGALIGVMVAVALMPPLVTFGMLLGAGQVAAAIGAFALVAVNVICVNLAGVATFLFQGVRPRTWWEAERAKKATLKASLVWGLLLLALLSIMVLK